jgi:hypothetical protein
MEIATFCRTFVSQLRLAFCAKQHYSYRYAATLLLLPFLGVSSLDLGPLVQTSGLLSFRDLFFF